ncbi:MAG: hypothetical protein AAF806_26780 [Bacteroidota bacterium]
MDFSDNVWIAIIALIGTFISSVITMITALKSMGNQKKLTLDLENIKHSLSKDSARYKKQLELEFVEKENEYKRSNEDIETTLDAMDICHISIQKVKDEIKRLTDALPGSVLYEDIILDLNDEVSKIKNAYQEAAIIPDRNVTDIFHSSKKISEELMRYLQQNEALINSSEPLSSVMINDLENYRSELSAKQEAIRIHRRNISKG